MTLFREVIYLSDGEPQNHQTNEGSVNFSDNYHHHHY